MQETVFYNFPLSPWTRAGWLENSLARPETVDSRIIWASDDDDDTEEWYLRDWNESKRERWRDDKFRNPSRLEWKGYRIANCIDKALVCIDWQCVQKMAEEDVL